MGIAPSGASNPIRPQAIDACNDALYDNCAADEVVGSFLALNDPDLIILSGQHHSARAATEHP